MSWLTGILTGANNKAIAAVIVSSLGNFFPDLMPQFPWLEEAIVGVLTYAATYAVPNAGHA